MPCRRCRARMPWCWNFQATGNSGRLSGDASGAAGLLRLRGHAFGPGGLARRVGRHAMAEKKRRWHIDYLTAMATLDEVWYTTDKVHRECPWADALREIRGATVPLERFGSSDCRCRSHLVFFQKRPSLPRFVSG